MWIATQQIIRTVQILIFLSIKDWFLPELISNKYLTQ